jgi:hypothetical protein
MAEEVLVNQQLTDLFRRRIQGSAEKNSGVRGEEFRGRPGDAEKNSGVRGEEFRGPLRAAEKNSGVCGRARRRFQGALIHRLDRYSGCCGVEDCKKYQW